MSSENYIPERKEKKYTWKDKILISETQIEAGLKDPTKYCHEIDVRSTSLIARLETLNASLGEMLTNYWAWNKHYEPTLVGRFIGCLMNKYKDILDEMPEGHAKEVYPLVFSFIQQADDLLRKLPTKNSKPFDRTLGDSVAIILNYLHDILKTDHFQSLYPVDPSCVFAFLEVLKKHQLISQKGLSGSVCWMGKLAESGYFDAVPMGRFSSFFKNQKITAEQAANYFNGIAELAQSRLLNRRISIECINFLLARIFVAGNLGMIDVTLDKLRKLIENKRISKVNELNLSCVDGYFKELLRSSESKSKISTSGASTLNLHALLKAVNSLSHICRDLKKMGSYRSDIHMLSSEAILEIFSTHKKSTSALISKILISIGHIVQAQGQKSSEKLKTLVKDLLNKINNPRSASWLHFDGIANALYGAFLLQVLAPTLTHELTDFFKAALKEEAQKPNAKLEKYHSYVDRVVQYIRHCMEPISEEMTLLIKQRRPLIDKHSFEYNLIEYVKTLHWFNKNQKMKDQFLVDTNYVDAEVDVLDEHVCYVAEIDGDIYHDPVKDRRRDQHLLDYYKKEGIETMGVIRIRVKKSTTILEAAEDWRIQFEARLKTYQQSKLAFSSDSSDESPREMKRVTTYSSDEEAAESIAVSIAMAQCLERGEGVPKDFKRAFSIYRSLAEAQSTESSLALLHLARCYEEGIGVKINLGEAVNLLGLAASKGVLEAQKKLATYYEQGIGVKEDFEKALYFHSLAAKQQDAESILSLAFYHLGGLVVDRDLIKGEKLLMMALRCKSQEVRSQFEDKVRDFLTDVEAEIIKDTDKKGMYFFRIRGGASDDLSSRLERLKMILNTRGKESNVQVLDNLVDIFLRGLKIDQPIQVSNLIKMGQVGRWAKAPLQGESQEKILLKDRQSEQQPLSDITNLPHKTRLEG